VSVKAASTGLTAQSGTTLTIANGRGSGLAVIITGVSATIPSGFGFLVETTTTDHTYAFHRLVPKATEVTTVAGISSNITTVANNTSNINAVAADATDIGTVAGSITNVNTTAGSISNVNTTAGSIGNVNTTAGDISNVNTVAGSISNVNSVAGSIANVNTTASNLANVNNFAATYQIASSAPSTDGAGNALAAGDLYFDTSSNELRVHNGTAFQGGVTATGNLAGLGTNTFTGNQSHGDNVKNLFGNSNDLEIYHNGNDSVIDEVGTGDLKIRNGGANKLTVTASGIGITGNISVSGTVDGRDLASDGSKLDGIESSATADQTAAEIRTLVESASDSNVFTDADHTKLNGIEASATADQTAAEIRTLVESASDSNVFTDADHTKLNGVATSATANPNAIDNIVEDSSPQLGGNLDVQSNKITTATSNGNIQIEPNGTGVVEIRGAGGADGTLQLNCSAQSHGVKIKSPAHSAGASYTLTLPVNIVNGQFLKTDANGVLSWAAVDLTALSASNLTSGTIPDARFPATLPAVSGANLTNIASAEVYGFTGLANGTLQVTTTNKGADNISGADYAAFEDTLFAASGFSFSVNQTTGNLIATI